MQIEQEVGLVDDRPQRARPFELDRVARAVERRRVPQPVEILIDIARRDRIARVEFAVGRDIVEGQRQLSTARPDPGAQQLVERYRPADLVAVGQRGHQDMRTGLTRDKARDVLDAGIAGAIRFDIGRRQLNPVGEIGHWEILLLAVCDILHAFAGGVTRSANRRPPGRRPHDEALSSSRYNPEKAGEPRRGL